MSRLNLILSRHSLPKAARCPSPCAKSTALVVLVVLLLGVTASSPTTAGEQTDTERQTVGVASQGATVALKPTIEIMSGTIDSVDERNDTIKIRFSSGTSQPLKVQDGLIFNAVRFGDLVEVSVQDIAGVKTIVGIEKK
jgi:hypothetical protein